MVVCLRLAGPEYIDRTDKGLAVPNQQPYQYSYGSFEVSGTHQVMWLPAWKDINDEPIVNSASLLPVKPVHVPVAVFVYVIKTVLQHYDDATWRAQSDVLNSTIWRGWNAREAWCSADFEQVNANAYQVKYTIRCKRKPWDIEVPNCGANYLDASNKIRDFISQDGGGYVGNLNASGNAEPPGTLPNISSFIVKPGVDFSSFLPG